MTAPSQTSQTSEAPAIAVAGLRKSYGDHTVLDGIDLSVAPGTIFALLGPNGAGKTTMVQILSTLIHADGGRATVLGADLNRDPAKVRELIGVTGQYSAVDGLLTGRENLMLMASLYHLGKAAARARTDALLAQFELTDAADKMAITYSGGMRRKLDLAMTLVAEPRLIFLDEPTAGLDPRSRRTMWQIVADLAERGVTIFLTTQYLEEADQLADHIALLDHGMVVARGTPGELKRMIPGGHITLGFADAGSLARAEALLTGSGVRADAEARTLDVPTDGSVPALRTILNRLGEAKVDVAELAVHTPDLDDVFLTLTGSTPKETQS